MTLASRITALLTSLTRNQVAAISRDERRLLREQLQRVQAFCDGEDAFPRDPKPKAGILNDLGNGFRSEDA